jgi:hypothetical protein
MTAFARGLLLAPGSGLWAAVLAFAVLRLASLTRYPPWSDESWTLELVRQPLRTMLRMQADEQTQQPLFSALLWVWTRMNPWGADSLAWLRLLPALFGIATAVPMLLLCRAAGLERRATALAITIGAGSQMLVAYSSELRAYSLYALLATWSLVLWLRVREEAGNRKPEVGSDASPGIRLPASGFRALTLVNIVLLWTHLFGVLVLAAEWIDAALGTRRRLRAFTLSAAVAIASVIPWEALVIRRALVTGERLSVVSWIPATVSGDLLDPLRVTIGESPWLALDLALVVLAGGGVALWVLRARRGPHGGSAGALLIAVVAPVLLLFAVSVSGAHATWVTRYLIVVAPPLCVLLGAALDALVPRWLTALAVAMALWPAAVSVLALARGEEKPRWDSLVRAVESAEPGSATVPLYSTNYDDGGPARWAARHAAPRVEVTLVLALDSVRADSGWILWSEHDPPRGLPPAAALIRRGFRVGPSAFTRGMRDSIVALRFARSRKPEAGSRK